jgi:hypothetical protein
MDNLISGFIAAAIFIPFVGGLAVSIGASRRHDADRLL